MHSQSTTNTRISLRSLALAVTLSTVLGFNFSGHLYAADPINVGGSNYAWYSVDQSILNSNQDQNCRERFGIIANYHQQQVSNTVKRQLDSMFRNGQRKLRIPIFHANDLTTGTILSSTGGNLTGVARNNLINFLADIKAAGFQEILVGFFPISRSNPGNWYREFGTSDTVNRTWFYDSATLQENWNLIRNLRPIIIGANMDYKIDLLNEGAASSTQPISRQYTGDLWSRYNAAYGKSDTVGFSVATGSRVEAANPDRNVIGDLAADRYITMKRVYDESGYGAPNVWDFHFYDDLDRKFRKVDAAMNAQGDTTDIIIGETYYQDPNTLSVIQNLRTSRQIRSIYAWPITTDRGCDGHADIPFPDEYFYQPQMTGTLAVQQPEVTVPQVTEPPVSELIVIVPETPEPTITTPVTAAFTICASVSSDADGDGWGWENNSSCRVADSSNVTTVTETSTSSATITTVVPVCLLANSDTDGDGYGWENNGSCLVSETSTSNAAAAQETSATVVTGTTQLPVCQLTNSDIDGDGYGWENQATCIVSNSTVSNKNRAP